MRYTKHLFIRSFCRCAAPACLALLCTVSAALGGCTDETADSPSQADGLIPLSLEIKADGFTAQPDASPNTRYTEDKDYATGFGTTDIIGLFAIKNIGTADAAIVDGIDNTKMTFTQAPEADQKPTWHPADASVTLYYYADVTYIAYYPYKENITIDPTQGKDAILASFAEKPELQPAADQSTLDGYAASDLMTASAKATDTSDPNRKLLSLSFTHSYSLLVLKTNRKSAKYISPDGTFNYHPDVTGLIADADAADMTVWGIKAFKKTDGVFHAIIKNVNSTLSGSYATNGMLVELNQSPTGLAYLQKGKRYECTVNTTMPGTVGATKRPVKVGDFYFKDGTIWPGGLDGVQEPQPPKTSSSGGIGVVFWAGNPAVGNEHGFGGDPMLGADHPLCKHGLVLYKQGMTVTAWDRDSSYSIDYWIKNTNPFPGITFDITAQNACQGYSNTKAMRRFVTNNTQGINKLGILNTMTIEDIAGTSGWYIPSFAEASLIIHGEGYSSGAVGRDLMNQQLRKLYLGSEITDGYSTPWTSTEQIGSGQTRDIMVVNFDGTQGAIGKDAMKAVRIVLAF